MSLQSKDRGYLCFGRLQCALSCDGLRKSVRINQVKVAVDSNGGSGCTRYPQFYSRVGFLHEFRPLSNKEIRRFLARRCCPAGVTLPEMKLRPVAAIVRITGGNFRLLNRVLTQMERIAKINGLDRVDKMRVRRRQCKRRPRNPVARKNGRPHPRRPEKVVRPEGLLTRIFHSA